MNDRFKYRVWDKENKCMHYPSRYHNYSIVNGIVVKIESYPTANSAYLGKRISWEFDDAVIMQCTDLKDKNGKLIYEADIIRFKDCNDILVINYQKEMACFAPQFYRNGEYGGRLWFDDYDSFECQFYKSNNFEVIGNIYENKDLLNA